MSQPENRDESFEQAMRFAALEHPGQLSYSNNTPTKKSAVSSLEDPLKNALRKAFSAESRSDDGAANELK